eukprot:jgi/Picsp_1/4761/NSC_02129-R1_protein
MKRKRPSVEVGSIDPIQCIQITNALIAVHGKPTRATDPLEDLEYLDDKGRMNQRDREESSSKTGEKRIAVLDSLIRTILSQNTTDKTSIRAYAELKRRFPEWESVRIAKSVDVEDAIRQGGLAEIKVQRIKAMLNTLKSERGECDLEWLRGKDTEFIKEYLGQFKGIGPKTIACTLMFSMHRDDFPVDTHVLRISKQLSWIPKSFSRVEAYEYLNSQIPDDVKYDLHVLLVTHGKECRQCQSKPVMVKDKGMICALKQLAHGFQKKKRVGKMVAGDEKEDIIIDTEKNPMLVLD